MSLRVTLVSLYAARDDLAPHLGHLALPPGTQDFPYASLLTLNDAFVYCGRWVSS